jgi:hypothetical protein
MLFTDRRQGDGLKSLDANSQGRRNPIPKIALDKFPSIPLRSHPRFNSSAFFAFSRLDRLSGLVIEARCSVGDGFGTVEEHGGRAGYRIGG